MTRWKRAMLAGLCAVLGSACIPDSDRCGPAMQLDADHGVCVCVANAVPVVGGCAECQADEVVIGTSCGCAAGQAKNQDGVCAVAPGLGESCSAEQACIDATYSYCAPASAGSTANTCTKACTDNSECGDGYTCATWEVVPYCRAYSGIGASCAAQADCASYDASTCDTVQTHTCFVAGCSLDAGDCPRDQTCCDLSSYGAGTACLAACP